MKSFFFMLLILIFSQLSYAVREGGNGGGLWVCYGSGQIIQTSTLVDLFEAKEEFGLTIEKSALTWNQIVENKLKQLEQEGSSLSPQLSRYVSEVIKNKTYVNGILTIVDDSLFRVQPMPGNCLQGHWEYVQFANFTQFNSVLIRKDLWNHKLMSEIDRAALVFHEAVYKMLRDVKGDKTSVRARRIVGLILADISPKQREKDIRITLATPE